MIRATGGLAGTEIAEGIPVSLPLLTVSMSGPAPGNVAARFLVALVALVFLVARKEPVPAVG